MSRARLKILLRLTVKGGSTVRTLPQSCVETLLKFFLEGGVSQARLLAEVALRLLGEVALRLLGEVALRLLGEVALRLSVHGLLKHRESLVPES